jgi:hypothetical protein
VGDLYKSQQLAFIQNKSTKKPAKSIRPCRLKDTSASSGFSSYASRPELVKYFFRDYISRMYANISGATMVASLSITNFGPSLSSLPQVIFSLGTAPE